MKRYLIEKLEDTLSDLIYNILHGYGEDELINEAIDNLTELAFSLAEIVESEDEEEC